MKLSILLAGAGFVGLCAALTVAGPADAAACSATASAAAKALCSNPKLQQADQDVTAAFDAALALTPEADKAALQEAQKVWREDRDTNCSYADDGESPAKPKALASCLAAESRTRVRYLSGLPEAGPGSGDRMVPVIKQGTQGFISSLRFADPKNEGEKLINTKLDGELAGLHIGTVNKPDDYSDDLYAELTYADPHLVSIEVSGSHFTPADKSLQPFEYNLNVDLDNGKALGFSDAFTPDLLPRLQKLCIGQLGDYFALSDDKAADRKTVEALVADLGQWSFGADKATITIDPGDEDPYQCHFGYGELRPLIRPGFPLPS